MRDVLTFVIPAYNEEARLERCINSIRAEDPHARIIVINNNSTDKTWEIARKLKVVTFHESRQGITWARQMGLRVAKTTWVAFIDADNELMPGWFDRFLTNLVTPNVAAISGPVVYPELRMTAQVSTFLFYAVGKVFHLFMPMVQGGNFAVNRQAMIDAGGFATNISFYGEDTATAIRLAKLDKRIIFDLGMIAKTSARRLKAEGWITIGVRYALNYFWMWTRGRPWTQEHHNHR